LEGAFVLALCGIVRQYASSYLSQGHSHRDSSPAAPYHSRQNQGIFTALGKVHLDPAVHSNDVPSEDLGWNFYGVVLLNYLDNLFVFYILKYSKRFNH
jgi:hypothetical protein